MTLDKQLKDLNDKVAELEQRANEASARKEIAQGIADSLETHNKVVLADIEAEATSKRKSLEVNFNKQQADYNHQLSKLSDVKVALQTEIEELLNQKESTLETIDAQEAKLIILKSDSQTAKNTTLDAKEDLRELKEQISNLSIDNQQAMKQNSELISSRNYIKEDIEALNTEALNLENKIIDLDNDYKAREQDLKANITQYQLKLKNVLQSLQEASIKDKQIREGWAEGQLKLDKRTKVVRKREILAEEAQEKVQQYNDYMKM